MSRDSPVLELARELITRQSVTPEDVDCQQLIGERLHALGFTLAELNRGGVKNLWATWGEGSSSCVLAGHTDVVPTGPVDQWQHPPFAAVVDDQWLHGRGAADMKASLAAMVVACERLIRDQRVDPNAGQIAFLITSDEEGPAIDGTRYVVDWLRAADIIPEYCIVGEPSSSEKLGDVVRNGRRGSLNARLTVHGTQGHVAYPDLADNPIHRVVGFLDRLRDEHWDDGNDYYPPTSLQISNLHSGTGATNVIPGAVEVDFNLRFCTEQTALGIQRRVETMLDAESMLATHAFDLTWNLSGEPFLTPKGPLTDALSDAIFDVCGHRPALSTSGGTSDGRFIATLGTQVVELGPVNATIHKIDERVAVADLEPLADIYQGTLTRLRS